MTSVMLVHEHHLLGGAIAAVLANEPDLDVAAPLSPADDVVSAARSTLPDVVLIHTAGCGPETLALARRLTEAAPGTAVLLVTAQHTPEVLRAAVDAGVSGVLGANTAPAALVAAVHRLAAGERLVDPVLLASALSGADNPLTTRQRDVLRLAADGLDARAIGRRLFLSPGTVRNYLSAAVRQVDGRNVLDAANRARRRGWL